MEPCFEIDSLLPQMKLKLMSGTRNTQMWVIEQILKNLKKIGLKKDHFVEKLVKCDIISIICDAMQATSDEHFVKVIIEFLDIVSVYKEFYENHTAMSAVKSMLSISYCVHTSFKDTIMFEQIVQCVCNILVRSMKLAIDFDNVCIPQQVIFFIKDLDIQNLQNDKIKCTTITMLNVVLQQVTIDEHIDVEIIIDVSCDALKLMKEIVKYDDNDNMISQATVILCGICAGSSRFCFKPNSQTEKPEISQKKNDLLIYIYNMIQDIIIPYVKDADLSLVDLNEIQKNFIFCLNNLYRLKNCSHDKLSNHLVVNGYLKYFLFLAPKIPEKSRRNICTLLSQILSVLSKETFFLRDKDNFAYNLRKDFLDLISKNSTKQLWNDVVASCPRNTGTTLLILLYYHFQGTGENDIISLESLISRILLFSISKPHSVLIFKPLWFLFAVTSMSHECPNLIRNYKNAVIELTNILQELEISKFYTHHIDLLRYCLKCSNLSQNVLSQILNLWLIESDGDIGPLLSTNCDKIVRHLLIVIQNGYPSHVIDAAVKGFRHLIQIDKNSDIIKQIVETVWHMLPNILSSYHSDHTVAHIKAALELANIIQPHVIPIEVLIRSAHNIVNIILKKNTDSKFMTLVVTQAHILLVSAVSYKSFKVLQIYVQQSVLLKELFVYGFSKERAELSTISIKLLTLIIHCQEQSSIKCKVPIKIHVKSLLDLLINVQTSSNCTNEMQFICILLKQNFDGSAVVLKKISGTSDTNTIIHLYEVCHRIHALKYESQWDMVYQTLVTLLHFCNATVTTKALLSCICDTMHNYNLITNVVKTRYISHHFVVFVITWLYYRKTTCCNILWNPRSLCKSYLDKTLDDLKKYSIMLKDKKLKDDYQILENALSQFQ